VTFSRVQLLQPQRGRVVLHADRLDLEAEVRDAALDVLGDDLVDHDLVFEQFFQGTFFVRVIGMQSKRVSSWISSGFRPACSDE
jgi:hypothetical protein